jgi:hypothetical protein
VKLKSLLILFLFFLEINAYSQTLLGSQVDYLQIDTSKYEVRLVVFTDCRDSVFQLDSHGSFKINPNNAALRVNLSPTLKSIQNLSNYHDSVSSCSTGDSILGILEYVYIDTVDFNTTFSSMKDSSIILFEFKSNLMLVGTNLCITGNKRPTYNWADLYQQSDGGMFTHSPTFSFGLNQALFTSSILKGNNKTDSLSYALTPPLKSETSTLSY